MFMQTAPAPAAQRDWVTDLPRLRGRIRHRSRASAAAWQTEPVAAPARTRLTPADVAAWVIKTRIPPPDLVPGWAAGQQVRLTRCVRPSYRVSLMQPGALIGRRCLVYSQCTVIGHVPHDHQLRPKTAMFEVVPRDAPR